MKIKLADNNQQLNIGDRIYDKREKKLGVIVGNPLNGWAWRVKFDDLRNVINAAHSDLRLVITEN